MRENYKSLKWVIRAIIVVVVLVVVSIGLEKAYENTSSLFAYFIMMCWEDSFFFVMACFAVYAFYIYDLVKIGEKGAIGKRCAIFGISAAVLILIINLFPVSGKYKYAITNGKKPSKIEYKMDMLADMFSTAKKVTVTAESVDVYMGSYRRIGRRTIRQDVYYVEYTSGDSKFSSIESQTFATYVQLITEFKDTAEIEYYPNTGIIKSIDGIDKNNTEALRSYFGNLELEFE